LLHEEFFPVCSPGLNDRRLPKDPASMLSMPVYPIASESNPALMAFRDWLVEEALRTYEALASWSRVLTQRVDSNASNA
jgi:hypothetical protein